jgi:hypothetical protein
MRKYIKRIKYPIIKYNPIYRDESGCYIKNEWTGYSDIGKKYDGKVLTRKDYEKSESLYIEAVFLAMSYFGSYRVKINHTYKLNNRQKAKLYGDSELFKELTEFASGDLISDKRKIIALLKLKLREYIGELELIIESKSRTEILFGFDYYMYIKTNKNVMPLLKQISDIGLFVN